MTFDEYERNMSYKIEAYLNIKGKPKYADFLATVFDIVENIRNHDGKNGEYSIPASVELLMFVHDQMYDIENCLNDNEKYDYAQLVATWREIAVNHIHLEL